jgi:hypothetical protein
MTFGADAVASLRALPHIASVPRGGSDRVGGRVAGLGPAAYTNSGVLAD